jgi:hypothetical protein
MLEELKAENPAEELIKLIKHWMVIKKGHPDEFNISRKADITINASIACSLIKIAYILEDIRTEIRRNL